MASSEHQLLLFPSSWWLQVQIFFWSVLTLATSQTVHQVYLNSYAHCGNSDSDIQSLPYKNIDENIVYNVQDDVNPTSGTHVYRNCEMVFRSSRQDGQLCILQRQLKFDLCHIRLEFYDGWAKVDGVDKPNMTANCDRSPTAVEWCTTNRFLTIHMTEEGKRPSVRDIHVDLLVYDIQSKHRSVYLDSPPYCNSKLQLDSSQIMVSNVDPNRLVQRFSSECVLTFEYIGNEENKTLCVVFISKNNPQCTVPYQLKVSDLYQDKDGNPKKVLQNIYTCEKPLPHKWCSAAKSISFDLIREPGNGTEFQTVFMAAVLDHEGGPETLPEINGKEENLRSSWLDENGKEVGIIAGAILAGLIIIALLIIILYVIFRRHQQAADDKPVKKNSLMLANGSSGYCKNEYDDDIL